ATTATVTATIEPQAPTSLVAKHTCLAQQVTMLTNEHHQLAQEMCLATSCAADHKAHLAQLTAELDALMAANNGVAKVNTEAHHQYQDLARALNTERHTTKQALHAKDLAHFLALEALSEVEGQITTNAQTQSELFAEWQGAYNQLIKQSHQLKAEQHRVDARALVHHRAVLDFAQASLRPAAKTA
ncbi:hypothetical protein H4R34_005808, partial [Dimargaris verticillata]